MSLARRSLMEAAARSGWRRAYGTSTAADALLTEQTNTAYTEAAVLLADTVRATAALHAAS